MRVVGLITEYNPFHNGHLYHLQKSKEISGCDYTVAIMSGHFVQRGEPSIVDKWTRAKMAVDSGVDLVIELPTVFAVQSAEYFAKGSVGILNALGLIDSIVFGSEIGNIGVLKRIASVLVTEPESFKQELKTSLANGNGFPFARSEALEKYFETTQGMGELISNIVKSPNNILAIEYLKALEGLKSNIEPITIKRVNANYHDKILSGSISSATSIRHLLSNKNDLENIKQTVPQCSYTYLKAFLATYHTFNNMNGYSDILLYLLRTISHDHLKKILDVEEGLDNRILKCGLGYNHINEVINCIKTKRYTQTRIQRILIHLLLNLEGAVLSPLDLQKGLYARVLAANSKGLKILSKAKDTSRIPLITKFTHYNKLDDEEINRIIAYDIKATNLYYIGLKDFEGPKGNLDYTTTPYIKMD